MEPLSEARRVRRKDLYDSDSDSGSDQEGGRDPQVEAILHEKLNAQLSGLFDFSFAAKPEAAQQQQVDGPQASSSTSNAQQEADQPGGGEGEEVFTFRLFRDEALTHTVMLTPDEDPAALGEGGFVVPSRPQSYYIASAPSPRKMSEYRSAAVSAEYVFADARRRRWGLEKPWRVIHISAPSPNPGSSKSAPGSAQGEDSGAEEIEEGKKKKKKKRKRPGKKHRILLRVREKAAHEREETARKQALEKELHVQEKKKRLNRERKLKRRQKEREKKAEGQATDPDGSSKDVGGGASVSGNEE
ncbi:hypothetical protein F5B17DRAFT_437510 [Nemania serpens]|nr:hypothetical protein F5B17DRAFT_437510 [Nemania serpens]